MLEASAIETAPHTQFLHIAIMLDTSCDFVNTSVCISIHLSYGLDGGVQKVPVALRVTVHYTFTHCVISWQNLFPSLDDALLATKRPTLDIQA